MRVQAVQVSVCSCRHHRCRRPSSVFGTGDPLRGYIIHFVFRKRCFLGSSQLAAFPGKLGQVCGILDRVFAVSVLRKVREE